MLHWLKRLRVRLALRLCREDERRMRGVMTARRAVLRLRLRLERLAWVAWLAHLKMSRRWIRVDLLCLPFASSYVCLEVVERRQKSRGEKREQAMASTRSLEARPALLPFLPPPSSVPQRQDTSSMSSYTCNWGILATGG